MLTYQRIGDKGNAGRGSLCRNGYHTCFDSVFFITAVINKIFFHIFSQDIVGRKVWSAYFIICYICAGIDRNGCFKIRVSCAEVAVVIILCTECNIDCCSYKSIGVILISLYRGVEFKPVTFGQFFHVRIVEMKNIFNFIINIYTGNICCQFFLNEAVPEIFWNI